VHGYYPIAVVSDMLSGTRPLRTYEHGQVFSTEASHIIECNPIGSDWIEVGRVADGGYIRNVELQTRKNPGAKRTARGERMYPRLRRRCLDLLLSPKSLCRFIGRCCLLQNESRKSTADIMRVGR